jgi:hypothetical protein
VLAAIAMVGRVTARAARNIIRRIAVSLPL